MQLESLLIVGFGLILGIVQGLVFAWLSFKAIDIGISDEDSAFEIIFHIPWKEMILYMAIATFVALLAAAWPAFRAARLNIIKALARR